MLSKMKNREGFTLIELMIVVAIIGILAAIAIPQFASYRQRAQDSAAQSALKNLATAQEDYYVQYETYTPTIGNLSATYQPDTNISLNLTAGNQTSWTATAKHKSSTKTFTWDSANGGLQ